MGFSNKSLFWSIGLLLAFFAFFPLVEAQAVCGNGQCESPLLGGNENPCTCPQDCGACAPSQYDVCVDYACDSNNVCRRTTTLGCCGNGTCEASESFGICAVDCRPSNFDFSLIAPDGNASFARGEKALISIHVTSEGKAINSAEVDVNGLGRIKLFNDGRHGDGTSSDGVYANYWTIPVRAPEGRIPLTITAELPDVLKEDFEFELNVRPELNAQLQLPSALVLGDNLSLSGVLKRGPEPLEMDFNLQLRDTRDTVLDSKVVHADANGLFNYAFRTSRIDPPGEWHLVLSGMDSNQNRLNLVRSIQLVESASQRFLTVELIVDQNKVKKGEPIALVARVSDAGSEVSDATVKLVDPLNREYPFSFQFADQYSVSYLVPFELPLGSQLFRVRAQRTDGALIEGFAEIMLDIEAKNFSLDLVEPQQRRFSVGDPVFFSVHAEYGFNQPVLDANAFVIVNNKRVVLSSEGGGFYSGTYFVEESAAGSLSFEVVLEDRFGNKSSVLGQIESFGFGYNFYLQKYGPLLLLLIVIFSGLLFGFYKVFVSKAQQKQLEKRRTELIALEERAQTKYFEEASIEKSEYDQLMESYEAELKQIQKKLGPLPPTPTSNSSTNVTETTPASTTSFSSAGSETAVHPKSQAKKSSRKGLP